MPPIFGSWGLLNCWVYHLRSLALRMHEIVVHWFLCTDIVVFCAHVCWHAFNPELTKFEGLIMWILLKPSEVERFHGHHNFVDWKMKKIRKLNNQQVPLLGIKSAVVQYFFDLFLWNNLSFVSRLNLFPDTQLCGHTEDQRIKPGPIYWRHRGTGWKKVWKWC